MYSRMCGRSSSYALLLLAALILFAHAASVYADNPSQGPYEAPPKGAQTEKKGTEKSDDTVKSDGKGKEETESKGCTTEAMKDKEKKAECEKKPPGKVIARDKDGNEVTICVKGDDCKAKLAEMESIIKGGGAAYVNEGGKLTPVNEWGAARRAELLTGNDLGELDKAFATDLEERGRELAELQAKADDIAALTGRRLDIDVVMDQKGIQGIERLEKAFEEGTGYRFDDADRMSTRLRENARRLAPSSDGGDWDMANTWSNLTNWVNSFGQGGVPFPDGGTFSFENNQPVFTVPRASAGSFMSAVNEVQSLNTGGLPNLQPTSFASTNPFLQGQNQYASLQAPQNVTFQSLAGLQQGAPQGSVPVSVIGADGKQVVWNPFTGKFEPLVDASQLPPVIDPKTISFTPVADATATQIEQAFAELDSGEKTFQELAGVAAFPVAPNESTNVPGTVLTNLTPEERAAVLPTFGQAVSAWSEGKINNLEFARQIGQNLAESSRSIFQRFGFAQTLPEGGMVDPPFAENGVPTIPVERSPIAPVGSVGVVLPGGAIVSFDPDTIGRLADGRGVRFGDLVQVAADGSTTVDLETLRSTAEAVGADLDSFPLRSEKALQTANVFTESRGAYTGVDETKPFEGTVGGVLAEASQNPEQYDSRINGDENTGSEYVYSHKDTKEIEREQNAKAAAEQPQQPPSAWERVKMAASCMVRQCSAEEAAFVARGVPLPADPKGTIDLPGAGDFASSTNIPPEEKRRMQDEANRTGKTVYWQDGDVIAAFVPRPQAPLPDTPVAEGVGATPEVASQPKPATADGAASPGEVQAPVPIATAINNTPKDVAEPPKTPLAEVPGVVVAENAGQIPPDPSLVERAADAGKSILKELFGINDAQAAQGAKTRFGIKAGEAAPNNWVSKNLQDILAPQGCSARDHSCYTSPVADAEAYFSKLIGQPEYRDGCQPLTVRCIIVGKWVSDDSAWRAKVGARAVQINPEGHANDVVKNMREFGVDVSLDTVLDLSDKDTRLALAKAMSKRELPTGEQPYADNILEQGYQRAVARFGGAAPAPTLSGGENDILYRALSGKELAAAERTGVDNIADALRKKGYNVEVVERKGVYKATRPGEETAKPFEGIVTHSTGDKDNSAELYVREAQNRGLFKTAYQAGIDCDENGCKITLARSEDKWPTPLRDNHVSLTSNRRPDAPNPDLANWNTFGVAVPGASGRALLDTEKQAAADLAQEVSREFGVTRVTAHGLEDYKDDDRLNIPVQNREGVAMRDAMQSAIDSAGPTEPRVAGARQPSSDGSSAGRSAGSRIGSSGADRPTLYDTANYTWDKLTDVFQNPAQAARLAFGFDGGESVSPAPDTSNAVVTYPHWGNEGGQSSGTVTNEILSRLPQGTEISIPHTASFAEAKRILDNCTGCVVKFYMESNPNERNDAGYGMSIPSRITQAAKLADDLTGAGYGDRVRRSIEPDAARDYFDARNNGVAVEHARLIKAAGFEYEAKSLSGAQIEQLQREAGVTVRTAVFEDPKNPTYRQSLEESIASGRPTTVVLKGVPTPGYANPDTRAEAVALAEEFKDARNLTVVYTPAGGIPELLKVGDASSVARGASGGGGILQEGLSYDKPQTPQQVESRVGLFKDGGLLWEVARETIRNGFDSIVTDVDPGELNFDRYAMEGAGTRVVFDDNPTGQLVTVDTRGGVQAGSRYVDDATARLQDQVQRSVDSGALPQGSEIVSREEALRRAAELPNTNRGVASFGQTGKTTGALAADTINATDAKQFVVTPDGKFYAIGQEVAKTELPTKEGIQAVADRMKGVFGCDNRGCLNPVSYAGSGASLPEDVRNIMQNKFGLGGASNPNGKIAAVTIAAFAGACEMDPADCQGVYINSAQRNTSGVGSARHTSNESPRAFDLQGFRDNDQKVRFLTRMAAIGEAMGQDLKANIGQGGNVTHIDFNGSEVSAGGGWAWTYPGGQSSAQAALHSAVQSGRLSDSFITNALGANLSTAAPQATLQPVVGGGDAVALPASSAKGYAEVIAMVYGPPTPESQGTAVQRIDTIARVDPSVPVNQVTRFDPNTGRIYTIPAPAATPETKVGPTAPWSPSGGNGSGPGGSGASPFAQIAQSLGNMFGGGQGGGQEGGQGGGKGGGQGAAPSGSAPSMGVPANPTTGTPAVAAATPAVLKFSCEPNALLKEGVTTVAWACGNNGTSKGTGFDTRGLPSGSVQISVATTTTFNLACYTGGALAGERQCTVALLKPKVVIVAVPSSVESGGSVRIGWITSQTKNCSFYGPGTILQGGGPHGTMEVKNLQASTRFKLACGTAAGVFETPLIVEVKGYSGPIVDAEVPAESVPAASSAKSAVENSSATGAGDTTPFGGGTNSAASVSTSSEGKFTATDASGNAVSLCDPAAGLFKFTQCLLGR